MYEAYMPYVTEVLREILAKDSPSGFTRQAADYAMEQFRALGYTPKLTNKGGVFCEIGGDENREKGGLLLSAHIDTLGAMVRQIKSNGRLLLKAIGGLNANNAETEVVRIYTRDGRVYTGNIQLANASAHVNASSETVSRNFDNVEVVLDEDVKTAEETKALGIEVGCYVCVDPQTVITESGYIKSRFLDDKLSAAILLGVAKWIKEEKIELPRKVYMHFTVYEEIGHGAAGIMPEGVNEILGVDMGCVGDGLECTERDVSICAADSAGPYDYDINCRLIALAKENELSYAVDVYPHYSSDCSVAVRCFDVRQALIGAGVYASHGYERSHLDGAKNTFSLLCAYLQDTKAE